MSHVRVVLGYRYPPTLIDRHLLIGLHIEVVIGRAGPGWAGPIVGRAKTGPGQNWPGFFRPMGSNSLLKAKKNLAGRAGPNLAWFFSGQ